MTSPPSLLPTAVLAGCCAPALDVQVEANPSNPFSAIVRVTSNRDARVVVEYGQDGEYDHTTPSQDVTADDPAEILVLGLVADTRHSLRAVASQDGFDEVAPPVGFTTDPLPDEWPTSHASGDTEGQEGEVVCTSSKLGIEGLYYCVNRQGEPVWSLQHPEGEIVDVVQPLTNGNLAVSSRSRSTIALFDPKGEMITSFSALTFADQTHYVHDLINGHEVIEITEGPWAGSLACLTVTFDDVQDVGEVIGAGAIIFDPETAEVHWDWTSHGELGDNEPIDPKLDYGRTGNAALKDESEWQHANALLHGVDDNGHQHVWINMRAQDWIVKVDVETDTIEWRLGFEGDFDLVDDIDSVAPALADASDWPYQCHAPEWQSRVGSRTRFLVFDNGIVRPVPPDTPQYSRAVELEIDEDTMLAQVNWAYGSNDTESDDWFFLEVGGDADMLPDLGRVQIVTDSSAVSDVSYPEGVEQWRWDLADTAGIYRVDWYPSLYEMGWWYEVER